MISVLLLITIAIAITGFVVYKNTNDDAWAITGGVGVFIGIVMLITISVMIGFIGSSRVYDTKIAMYEEENAKIEQSVVVAVEKYLEHEQSIFEDITNENLQTLLVVYPEIKSDTLITKQIEIFIMNNDKIRELKEEKISLGTLKFLVYFGG